MEKVMKFDDVETTEKRVHIPGVKGGKSGSVLGLEENLKKAVSEMLVLYLLRERDMYVNEITAALARRSGGSLSISFPYAILYRMIEYRYIYECEKKIAPDGRRRQYYRITPAGVSYLENLLALYHSFSAGVQTILAAEEGADGQ